MLFIVLHINVTVYCYLTGFVTVKIKIKIDSLFCCLTYYMFNSLYIPYNETLKRITRAWFTFKIILFSFLHQKTWASTLQLWASRILQAKKICTSLGYMHQREQCGIYTSERTVWLICIRERIGWEIYIRENRMGDMHQR